jgi:hypothetical protein
MDLWLARIMNLGENLHLQLPAESFNLVNRDNQTYAMADSGYHTTAGKFVKYIRKLSVESAIRLIISNLRAS